MVLSKIAIQYSRHHCSTMVVMVLSLSQSKEKTFIIFLAQQAALKVFQALVMSQVFNIYYCMSLVIHL